jgi:hypothetical protein
MLEHLQRVEFEGDLQRMEVEGDLRRMKYGGDLQQMEYRTNGIFEGDLR